MDTSSKPILLVGALVGMLMVAALLFIIASWFAPEDASLERALKVVNKAAGPGELIIVRSDAPKTENLLKLLPNHATLVLSNATPLPPLPELAAFRRILILTESDTSPLDFGNHDTKKLEERKLGNFTLTALRPKPGRVLAETPPMEVFLNEGTLKTPCPLSKQGRYHCPSQSDAQVEHVQSCSARALGSGIIVRTLKRPRRLQLEFNLPKGSLDLALAHANAELPPVTVAGLGPKQRLDAKHKAWLVKTPSKAIIDIPSHRQGEELCIETRWWTHETPPTGSKTWKTCVNKGREALLKGANPRLILWLYAQGQVGRTCLK